MKGKWVEDGARQGLLNVLQQRMQEQAKREGGFGAVDAQTLLEHSALERERLH